MAGQARRPSGARTAWGWHRLSDEWAARLVAAAGVRLGELVLDMGAGRGALTGPLLEAGARVIAVERHPGRAAYGIRGPGVRDMGRRWDLRLGMPVPRRAFTPPPRVDSVVLLARRR